LIDSNIQYHLKKPSNVRKKDFQILEKPRSYQSTFLRKTKSRLSPIIQSDPEKFGLDKWKHVYL